MKPDLGRAQEIFSAALGMPEEERSGFVHTECRGDAALQKVVERLLFHSAAPDTPAPPLVDLHSADGANPPMPASIGRYQIKGLLGSGGMGVVYLAEQPKPRRLVAIKVLSPLMTSGKIQAKFDTEAELLGRLQHPGIAQIYESGKTKSDEFGEATFIAMEYVDGDSLGLFADKHKLGSKARIRLLIKICQAVHHAHIRNIIHRDLKPANILVTEDGRPKILDFGIAKTVAAAEQGSDSVTLSGVSGTPGYMSPEQAAGALDIGPTTDIYTLGVIASSLLAAGEDQENVSSEYRTPPQDLKAILQRAGAFEPADRYASAHEFAADLQRFLDCEPVLAREQTPGYRLSLFIQRNKILVALGTLAACALIATSIATLIYAKAESEAAALAKKESLAARRLAYAGSMAAAVVALDDSRVFEARYHLDQAPAELRGWEWNHLYSRLDDSTLTIDVAPDGDFSRFRLGPIFSADGEQVAAVHRKRGGSSLNAGSGGICTVLTVWDRRGSLIRRVELKSLFESDRDCSRMGVTIDNKIAVFGSNRDFVHTIDPRHMTVRKTAFPAAPPAAGAPHFRKEGNLAWIWNEEEKFWEPALEHCAHNALKGLTSKRSKIGARIWSHQTQKAVLDVRHSGICFSTMNKKGELLATTSAEGSLRIWDLENSKESPVLAAQITREWLRNAAFSADGRLLVAADDVGTLHLVDTGSGQVRCRLRGHGDRVQGLAFDHSGRSICSASRDGTLKLWPATALDRPGLIQAHDSYVYPVRLAADGQRLVSGGWDSTIKFWDATSGVAIGTKQLDQDDPLSAIVADIAVNPSQNMIAYVTCRNMLRAKRVRILDPRTGEGIADLGTFEPCSTAAFDPRGEHLVVATADGARIFAVANWKEVATIPSGAGICLFNQRGQLLLSSAEDLSVATLWDIERREKIATFGGGDLLSAAAFSADNDYLALASRDRTIRVWETITQKEVASFPRVSQVYGLAFSPSGKRLAAGAEFGSIRIFDTQTWDEVAHLTGHEKYVWSVTWSTDGESLISGSGDGTIRYWDALSYGRKLERIESYRRAARALEVSSGINTMSQEGLRQLLSGAQPGLESDPDHPDILGQLILRRFLELTSSSSGSGK